MHHFQEILFLLPLDKISSYVRVTTPYIQYIFWSVTIVRGSLEIIKLTVKGSNFIKRKFRKKITTG